MSFQRGSIDGLWIFSRKTHADERGFFHEAFRAAEIEEAVGQPFVFVQANHSRTRKGALRGLHLYGNLVSDEVLDALRQRFGGLWFL